MTTNGKGRGTPVRHPTPWLSILGRGTQAWHPAPWPSIHGVLLRYHHAMPRPLTFYSEPSSLNRNTCDSGKPQRQGHTGYIGTQHHGLPYLAYCWAATMQLLDDSAMGAICINHLVWIGVLVIVVDQYGKGTPVRHPHLGFLYTRLIVDMPQCNA